MECIEELLLMVQILVFCRAAASFNKAIKNGPQKDVGRTAFHAATYGRRYRALAELEY